MLQLNQEPFKWVSNWGSVISVSTRKYMYVLLETKSTHNFHIPANICDVQHRWIWNYSISRQFLIHFLGIPQTCRLLALSQLSFRGCCWANDKVNWLIQEAATDSASKNKSGEMSILSADHVGIYRVSSIHRWCTPVVMYSRCDTWDPTCNTDDVWDMGWDDTSSEQYPAEMDHSHMTNVCRCRCRTLLLY